MLESKENNMGLDNMGQYTEIRVESTEEENENMEYDCNNSPKQISNPKNVLEASSRVELA